MRPVILLWDDDHFVPDPRHLARCRAQFVVGQQYPMEVVQPRNMASHRGYFAAIHEAWLNLNEEDAAKFKTSEHLRAWALVETGWCKETDYPCDSVDEAMMVAKIIRARSGYAIIIRSGNVVKVFDARSQAVYGPDAMSAEDFKSSKTAVLDRIAPMARSTRAQLNKEAGRSA
jgi:hypothetical protein